MNADLPNADSVSPIRRLADSPPQLKSSIAQRLIEFSAHNRVLVISLVAAAVAYAVVALKNIRLDAIPDLSDTQVIVYTKWDRSPDIMEDQVTYPIITALLGAPKVKAIRGFSDFGFSYVYVIFQDGTDTLGRPFPHQFGQASLLDALPDQCQIRFLVHVGAPKGNIENLAQFWLEV